MKTALTGIPELGAATCELYIITLLNGDVYRYTTAEKPLKWQNQTYQTGYDNTSHKQVLAITRGQITSRIGVEVDNVDVTLSGHHLFGEIITPAFAQNGGFDGARVTIYRARSNRTVHIFEGAVTDVKPSTYQVSLTVSSDLELLNIQMPRNTYQATCIHTLYDSGCGVVKTPLNSTITTTSGSNGVVISSGLTENQYALGVIEVLTGHNAGQKRTIKTNTAYTVYFAYPFDNTFQAGDQVRLFKGCNRTLTACMGFSNQDNFRAFPFIPQPENGV